MRPVSVTAAVCVSLPRGVRGGVLLPRGSGCARRRDWLLERSKAQASEYAESFDDTVATQQLETFAARRAVLERAHLWQRGQMLGLMAVAARRCALACCGLLRRLDWRAGGRAAESWSRGAAAEPVPCGAPVRPSPP